MSPSSTQGHRIDLPYSPGRRRGAEMTSPLDADCGPPGGHLTIDGRHGWFGTYSGIVFVTMAALPLAALTVWALARRRRLIGCTRASAWRTSLAEVGMVYGTVPWVSLSMPGSRAGPDPSQLSLVPLRDLLTMPVYQVAGNLLIFAAVGFLAPVRFSMLASLPRILALAAASSVLIETAQYVLPLDRVSSVDDVLLNTAGAGLAALASRRWWVDRPTVTGHVVPAKTRTG
jgi:hypothetical protein